ncbi:MAG: hypothetical protein KDC44_10665 [Phaeodactylibacter sp.]|nr:hypothetical protein [Phaeodactylibacter sp.]
MDSRTRDILQKRLQEGYQMDGSVHVLEGLRLLRQNSLPIIATFLLLGLTGGWLGAIHWSGFILDALVVTPILLGGAILMLGKAHKGQEPEWKDLLGGLPRALHSFLYTILYSLILLIVLSPTLMAMYQAGVFDFIQEVFANPNLTEEDIPDFSNINSTVIWLNLIPFVYLYTGFWWGIYLILFHGLNALEALEYSRRLVTRRWFSHFYLLTIYLFLFMTLGMILSVVAIAMPSIGGVLNVLISALIFFTYYSSLLVAFDKAVGLEFKEEEQGPDITQHLIDD